MALPATDSFTGVTGTNLDTYSASWTVVAGMLDIQSNQLAPDQNDAESGAGWNADTFADDQYAQVVLSTETGANFGHAVGPACRVAAANDDYYGAYEIGTVVQFFKNVNGTWTQFGSDLASTAVNDVLRIEAEGTTITYKVNGAEVDSVTDTSHTAGRGGVCGYDDHASARLIDNWEGGNLSVAASVSTPGKLQPMVIIG